jgi:GNAT superfamily N-acetyltransferase
MAELTTFKSQEESGAGAAGQRAHTKATLFAELLTPYLAQQFGYKRTNVDVGIVPTVCASTTKYDLYFRVTPPKGDLWDDATLVIARIGFKVRRKGLGRHLLGFIAECANVVGYSKVGIECANPTCQAFASKFAFQQCGASSGMNSVHMLTTVDELTERLARTTG